MQAVAVLRDNVLQLPPLVKAQQGHVGVGGLGLGQVPVVTFPALLQGLALVK